MQYRVLGPLEVVDDGEPLNLAGAKQRSLLALLLLHANEVVSRDTLIDALWGTKPPRDAEHSLESQVSRLRRVLHRNGEDVVLTRPPGYLLDIENADVDARRFERLANQGRSELHAGQEQEAVAHLREALSLWRGAVLEDVDLDSAAVGDLRAIEDRRLAAWEDLLEGELACGRHANVLPELELLVRQNPLRERLQAQLMLALYRSGRQADALDAYRAARRHFIDELGLEPGPELRALEQAVLRQDEALLADPSPNQKRRRGRLLLAAAGVLALLSAALGAVMLAVRDGSTASAQVLPNSVASFSPAGKKLSTLPTAGGANASAMAVCGGAVWVAYADSNLVTAFDSRTRTLQRIHVGQKPSGLACGAGLVWVANYVDGTVSRINPKTLQVVGTPIRVGGGPMTMAFGGGFAWVVNADDSNVARIDPRTTSVRVFEVGADPEGLAVTRSAVWVASRSNGDVWRIDPRSGRLEAAPIRVGAGPVAVAAGAGAVWVANELDNSVSRIDPATNRATTIAVGQGPRTMAAARDSQSVWVGNALGESLSRIDASDSAVTSTTPVGSPPAALTATQGGVLYVATRSGGARHRGGVLRAFLQMGAPTNDFRDPGSSLNWWIDPATSVSIYTSPLYDGLVGYRRVGGPEGSEIVPDLATTVPTPTNDGRTYVFRLRRGIRYSDGSVVKPEDLRWGLERTFALYNVQGSYNAKYYTSIIGARACLAHPRRCDLRRGIVTDDSANTVTYHLVRPDSEFLAKLAVPGAAAIPARTPRRYLWPHPPLGTGPYALVVRRHSLVYRRNRYFRVWSPEAKPDGYADEIVFTRPKSLPAALHAIDTGRADFWQAGEDFDALGPKLVNAIETVDADRTHVDSISSTTFMALNTHLAPFDDVRVRQALSYAIDRERIRRLESPAGRPTCQLLPPGFQSYRPYCPYSPPLASGARPASNLAKARKLIAASGTKGMRVTVWANRDDTVMRYVARLLGSLGYKTTLKGAANEWVLWGPGSPVIKRPGVQVVSLDWRPDYLAASNFFDFGWCGWYFGWFCDPTTGRLMRRAALSPDPAVATARWTAIDRRFVDLAPIVPLFNEYAVNVLSRRVGNYESSPILRTLFEDMWVR